MKTKTIRIARATAPAMLLALTALLAPADTIDASAFSQSFGIRFQGYSGSTALTDFPVLVKLSEATGFQYAKAATGGADLRISSVARSTDWIQATHDCVADDDFCAFEFDGDWEDYAKKFDVTFTGVAEGVTLESFPALVRVSASRIEGFDYGDCTGTATIQIDQTTGAQFYEIGVGE